jgi:hypothetical protein
MSEKIATNMNLTKEGRTLLERLAQKSGISMTAVVELAIREKAEKQGIDWTA